MAQIVPAKHALDPVVLSSTSMCFYLFGELAATLNGRWLPALPHQAQGLLAALLLYPRLLPREQLAGQLFPEADKRSSRQRLSHLLWQLRRWLPELPLETTSETLHLLPETLWLDIQAFRQAAAASELADWLAALSLYRGGLLEGLYDDWLLQEREALYLEYVHLSHRACDALWQQDRLEELLPLVERLTQHEPFDEHALRLLMQTYRDLGRRGAALAAYDRFVSLALDEMGIEPEPATIALAQALQSIQRAPVRPFSPPDGSESSEALLRRAQEALARGDSTQARYLLDLLIARGDCPDDEVRLLEIDLALFLEEHDHAAALLEQLAADGHPPSIRERLRSARLATARRDALVACDLASEVLVQAHGTADRETELGALLVLSSAQQQLGQWLHAARSAERAIAVARENGFAYGVARALTVLGASQLYQGRYQQARAYFYEARSVALEHDLRYDLAAASRGIRTLLMTTHALTEALATVQEELSLWRDLGLRQREAAALESLSAIQSYLGRSNDCLRTQTQAQELSEQTGDPMRIAINRYNLVHSLLYHDDDLALRAAELCRQALETFRAYGQLNWEATTLTILGYALWVNGQHAAAMAYYSQAQAASERAGELTFVPELLAYQGLAQLGLDCPTQALVFTRQAVASLVQGDVDSEVIPEIYYAHAMALAANGCETDAHTYLARAYEHLLDGAAQIEEEEARRAFFHHSPTLRRLMRELRARDIAPSQDATVQWVQLPALHGGEPLHIHWTVDAGPADRALKQAQGSIALRRARLARLLKEARARGAVPSVNALAQALDVSRRTVQRDLAVLRGE